MYHYSERFKKILGLSKGGQVTKPIIVVKVCYKLLFIIQVVKKIFDIAR